jgi:hypothetical protein
MRRRPHLDHTDAARTSFRVAGTAAGLGLRLWYYCCHTLGSITQIELPTIPLRMAGTRNAWTRSFMSRGHVAGLACPASRRRSRMPTRWSFCTREHDAGEPEKVARRLAVVGQPGAPLKPVTTSQ